MPAVWYQIHPVYRFTSGILAICAGVHVWVPGLLFLRDALTDADEAEVCALRCYDLFDLAGVFDGVCRCEPLEDPWE